MALPRTTFRRRLALPGWSSASEWGYDEVFECYWAELRADGVSVPVRIGPESLLVTLGALAGAVSGLTGCLTDDAYLALTG
ncbi:hypothetical protein Q6346_03865 [Isoptericola sp. b490]|uniref:hypothetical protein n=1 Tax=Actinotalea lenta TaxID=3064654 RepID=UPI002712E0FC|nr:hypothetical protein [Isoptericola sp. b490]MDO8120448.1 hypothetical protein [Isoptericola sp. b490]